MNEYDSNRILDFTKKINYHSTEDIKKTDCYILNTCHIREKATEKVFIFYDDGTKLESSGLNYNVTDGIGFSNSGVKMFGKWGIIESSSFSFDTSDHTIKFYNKPKLVLN